MCAEEMIKGAQQAEYGNSLEGGAIWRKCSEIKTDETRRAVLHQLTDQFLARMIRKYICEGATVVWRVHMKAKPSSLTPFPPANVQFRILLSPYLIFSTWLIGNPNMHLSCVLSLVILTAQCFAVTRLPPVDIRPSEGGFGNTHSCFHELHAGTRINRDLAQESQNTISKRFGPL